MPKCFDEIRNSRGGVHSGTKWPQLRPSSQWTNACQRDISVAGHKVQSSYVEPFNWNFGGNLEFTFRCLIFINTINCTKDCLYLQSLNLSPNLGFEMVWHATKSPVGLKMPASASQFKHRPHIRVKTSLSVKCSCPTHTHNSSLQSRSSSNTGAWLMSVCNSSEYIYMPAANTFFIQNT